MEEELITVKTFSFPADVTIVQSFMEMRGIEVFMKNLVSTEWHTPLETSKCR